MESYGKESETELSEAARSVTYTIRHVIRNESLDDELALRHARALLVEPLMGLTAEQEYSGLVEALSSTAALSTWWGDPRYEQAIREADFRAHLRRVVERLDAMRPWPTPLFRVADPRLWKDYIEPRLVGLLRLRVPKIEDRIRHPLVPITTGEIQHQVAVLDLRSGHQVAVVGQWWPDDPRSAAVLTRDADVSAETLMSELTSGDHFRPGEFEVQQA